MAAYEAGVRAFADGGFVWGDPDRLGHGKAHGAFGVLLRHHDKVVRFVSRVRERSASGRGSARDEDASARDDDESARGD